MNVTLVYVIFAACVAAVYIGVNVTAFCSTCYCTSWLYLVCRLHPSSPVHRVLAWTRADRKCSNTLHTNFLRALSGAPLGAAPQLTHRPADRKGQYLAKYISVSVPSCPLSSRCPAPAPVLCSWRHTQHGGQGDSVNISYHILILKAVKWLWRNRCRIRRAACLGGRVGWKLLSKIAAESPFILILHLYIGASLPASQTAVISFLCCISKSETFDLKRLYVVWKGSQHPPLFANAGCCSLVPFFFFFFTVVWDRSCWADCEKIKAEQWQPEVYCYW